MSLIETWDESKPAGSRALSLGDDDIRECKRSVRERLAIDHNTFATESGESNIGCHKKTTLLEQASDPTAVTDAMILYTKLADSYADLYDRHENSGVNRLTYLGKLWINALSVSGQTSGDLLYYDGSVWTRYPWATFIARLLADATFLAWAVSYKNAGDTVQVKNYQTGALATGTTTFPEDDTIPQNDEGIQVMTLAITPTKATNALKIEVIANGNSLSARLIVALFQDSIANALSVAQAITVGSGAPINVTTAYYMIAGTTSEITFKVRCGGAGGQPGDFTFNGHTLGRIWGGALMSSITITEIEV